MSNPALIAADPVWSNVSHEPSTSRAPTYVKRNLSATVPIVVGTFSPQRPLLRLDGHSYSPDLLKLIVTAGARLHSFSDAAFALSLTGLSISARHVQTLTEEVGEELAHERDQQALQRRRRQLRPRVEQPPEAVVVEVDGGHLRTRQPGCGPGVHQAQNKEAKVACLATLKSDQHQQDPQPEPPEGFLQPRRVQRLIQQMKGSAANPTDESHEPSRADESSSESPTENPQQERQDRTSPKRLLRTCPASMACSRSFGPMVAGEAQARNFYAAKRRAFVADGQAYNWSIQEGYFPDFEPIVDLLHVICYLHGAAQAHPEQSERWPSYVRWLRACWSGEVAEVLVELEQLQEEVGRPPPGEELNGSDPRQLVACALVYLEHNRSRMDYPRYRRMGLPTTSSLVESLVAEFNARVKAKQKFWNRHQGGAGAESILQVRAALLSEDDRLDRHFAQRPGSAHRRKAA